MLMSDINNWQVNGEFVEYASINRHKVHERVIEHYGWVEQMAKVTEELKEFSDEIWEYLNSNNNKDKLLSEFADVLNMIEQFEIIAKQLSLFTHPEVDKEQNRKMIRTLKRIEGNE
jgi:NTP pyrophosphatase (non-canonical NTP hydrolase)